MRNCVIVPVHPPPGQVHTTLLVVLLNTKPEIRYSLVELPELKPNVVPLVVTVHPPTDAQAKVTPRDKEKVIVLLQLYAPLSKVTVAPSAALPITLFTCDDVVPTPQVQSVPLPVHDAPAGTETNKRVIPTRHATCRIVMYEVPRVCRKNRTQGLKVHSDGLFDTEMAQNALPAASCQYERSSGLHKRCHWYISVAPHLHRPSVSRNGCIADFDPPGRRTFVMDKSLGTRSCHHNQLPALKELAIVFAIIPCPLGPGCISWEVRAYS